MDAIYHEGNYGKAIIEVNNFSLQARKLYTDPVRICGRKWRILLFPKGNDCDKLSIYLDYVSTSMGNCDAWFSIEVLDRLNPSASVKKEASHKFAKDETDWGFTALLSLATLNEQKGLLLDDKLVLSVEVRMRKGFRNAGLKNEWDDTYCFTALLHVLYYIPALRRAVYQLPTNNEDTSPSFARTLQRVFFRLEFGGTAVGTKALRESLGDLECLKRSNFKQLARAILNHLIASEMAVAKNDIQQWFQWKTEIQIKGIDGGFESTQAHTYLDITLNMQKSTDLVMGFRNFMERIVLDGNNKQFVKGRFLSPPRILLLYTEGERTWNPPQHIDLSEFTGSPSEYTLYCVIGYGKETYYPTIRIGSLTVYEWYLVNRDMQCLPDRTSPFAPVHALIYLRTADLPWLVSPFPKTQIPEELRTKLDTEVANRENKQEMEEKQLITVFVMTSYLRRTPEQDVFILAFRRRLKCKVPRTSSFQKFKRQIAADVALPPDFLGFWGCREDRSGLVLTSVVMNKSEPMHTMVGDSNRLYFLLVPSPTPLKAHDGIVFLQYYDPHLETLRDAGYVVVRACSPSTKLADIIPQMNGFIHQPPTSPLLVFEGSPRLPYLHPMHPHTALPIRNSNILVFQRLLEFLEFSTLRYPLASDYYRHLS